MGTLEIRAVFSDGDVKIRPEVRGTHESEERNILFSLAVVIAAQSFCRKPAPAQSPVLVIPAQFPF